MKALSQRRQLAQISSNPVRNAQIHADNAARESRERRIQAFYSVADTIAREWYRLAVRSGGQQFALWYRTAKEGEKMAIPLVSVSCPVEGYVKSIEISNAWPVDVAKRKIHDAMQSLPILGPVEF